MRKLTILGGGGVRTPLLIHGIARAQAALSAGEIALFDIDVPRAEAIARLGREVCAAAGVDLDIRVRPGLEQAVEGADFIVNSIRVGGIAARARDERIALENGLAGQETTGPGGAAMALRTIPVTLAYARIIEHAAPNAWFINFTNPAGLITQALTQNTGLRVVGICDTPIELFHRIAEALREPLAGMSFDYAGLNHLGWVRRVTANGDDVTGRLLGDPELLRRLHPAGLFDPALMRTLRLIPTEYLFFYYSQRRACSNLLRAGASRGEELERLNQALFRDLRSGGSDLAVYRNYLVRRSDSYMQLESSARSAFDSPITGYDPFEAATGYHRIAVDVMTALLSERAANIIVNVPNQGAIDGLAPDDVVEVPCAVDCTGARPQRIGVLPDAVGALVQSVKAYERTLIRASLDKSSALAQLAMTQYPIIGDWDLAGRLLAELVAADPEHLAYLAP